MCRLQCLCLEPMVSVSTLALLVRELGERLGWLGHVTSSGICNLMSRAVLESARAS